jgi:1-acyl-sn-glycerol-3-phosphate acyltransferase
LVVFVANSSDQIVLPRLSALMSFGMAYWIGAFAASMQRYPQRLAAFIPISWMVASIGFMSAWLAPGSYWSEMLLAFGLGLGHTAPRTDLLVNLPDSQRVAGLTIMAAAMAVGAALGVTLMALVPPAAAAPVSFAVALVLAGLAVFGYLRELVEQLVEPMLALTNPIRGYGPGLKKIPTRGPVLVVANHAAWFDPLWVAKLIPLRLRPMMTSKFYDKPIISWLMRHVFQAIRVPDAAFRREAPEIHEAIAALERGENVLIFPEGWLKRKPERSIRRFGQGVYQILREKPGTPVIVCWIEGNWGSYTSYWNGPPTVNKKPDFLRLIRIGISEPEVLSLDLLHDGLATRRHLMLKCLHARSYLGLPELPPPPFAQTEESDEGADSRD